MDESFHGPGQEDVRLLTDREVCELEEIRRAKDPFKYPDFRSIRRQMTNTFEDDMGRSDPRSPFW